MGGRNLRTQSDWLQAQLGHTPGERRPHLLAVFQLRPARMCPPERLGSGVGDLDDLPSSSSLASVVEAFEALDVTHQVRGYVSAGIRCEDAPADSLEWEDGGLKPGDEIPTPLGPHALLGLLGAGTFGRVYRARTPGTGPEVALKVCERTPE